MASGKRPEKRTKKGAAGSSGQKDSIGALVELSDGARAGKLLHTSVLRVSCAVDKTLCEWCGLACNKGQVVCAAAACAAKSDESRLRLLEKSTR